MKRPWNNEGGDGATVETVERTADAADPQARRFKKGFVRVGRMPRGEVVPLFRRAEVKQENAYRLAEFDAAATCTRCAYSARARGPRALERCFRDFAWNSCCSGWHRDGEAAGEAEKSGKVDAVLKALGTYRVLCVTRHGPQGTEAVNRAVAARLFPSRGEKDNYDGRVVMILKNNRDIGLYNGDVGVVLGEKAWFPADGIAKDVFAALVRAAA